MEIEKLIDTVDDVNTLRKICKAINKEARKFQLDYNRAVAEMRAFKEQNEKLQKLLEPDLEEEKEELIGIENTAVKRENIPDKQKVIFV